MKIFFFNYGEITRFPKGVVVGHTEWSTQHPTTWKCQRLRHPKLEPPKYSSFVNENNGSGGLYVRIYSF